MTRQNWPLACVFVALAATPLALPASAQDQVVSYNPDFFSSANPATAMDMINRLPGFAFDGGDGSRGFSGNAGNLQINGRRPSSKNEGLSTVLSRIVAADVERIDVMRTLIRTDKSVPVAVPNRSITEMIVSNESRLGRSNVAANFKVHHSPGS